MFTQMASYMVIGGCTGVSLYLLKYTLYGAVLLLGPGRDKYAAAAIEVDLSTIPVGMLAFQDPGSCATVTL